MMALKRLVLIVAVLALAIAPAAHADAPNLCTGAQHYTGEACQGLNTSLDPAYCTISVWVQKATCVLPVAGGSAHSIGLGWTNTSDGTTPVSYSIVVKASDGHVLYTTSASGGSPAPGGLWNGNGGNAAGTAVGPYATDGVTCEITGTHTVYGAATALSADAGGPSEAENSFSCSVNQ